MVEARASRLTRRAVRFYTGELHVAHLPLQREQQRKYLPGYPEGSMVAGADGVEGTAVDLLAADGPEPGCVLLNAYFSTRRLRLPAASNWLVADRPWPVLFR